MNIERVRPITGTENQRAYLEANAPDVLHAQELHTTTQRRLFLNHAHIGGWAWHGSVANEAAMLALNTTSPRGCWPGDMCVRVDTASVWLCIANRGTLIGEWVDLATVVDLSGLVTDEDLSSHAGDADAHKGQKHSVELDSGDLQLVGDVESPGANKVYGTDGSGARGWKNDPTSSGSGADDHAWVTEEVVTVGSAVGQVEFPTSSSFDPTLEYRIEWHGWSLATSADLKSQVNLGSGYVSSDYVRLFHLTIDSSGNSVSVGNTANDMLLSIAGAGAGNSARAQGWLQFAPGLQNGSHAYARFENSFRRSSGNLAFAWGMGCLNTPTNAAVTKLKLFASSVNTTAGTFILKSRPLTPTP